MNKHFSYLLQRFLQNQISEAELHDLSALLLESEGNEEFMASVETQIRQAGAARTLDVANFGNINEMSAGSLMDDQTVQEIIQTIILADKQGLSAITSADLKPAATNPSSPSSPAHRSYFLKTTWFRYAAVFLLLLGTGGYFWVQQYQQSKIDTKNGKHLSANIAPGKNGAILTLTDGTEVVLDSLDNGVITTQNGVQVVLNNGLLTYNTGETGVSEVSYNTVSTPKGRQFQIILPDGTKVWLNAGSSLRYLTAFTGTERSVDLEGEAYFEIAPDKTKPFRVSVAGMQVNVLGTSFNINAYSNENSINTTLVDGSINIASGGRKLLLKPGQQARLLSPSEINVLNNADIDKVLAWKNGLFNFEDATLSEVMKQLERWYNIEVIYEKDIPEKRFGGGMSRDLNLADVLDALQTTGVHFRMEEGRRLVVMK